MKRKKPITLVLTDEKTKLDQKEVTLELPEFTCQQLFESPVPPMSDGNALEVISKKGGITNHYHVQSLHWQVSIDGKVEKTEVDKFMYGVVISLLTLVVVFITLLLTYSFNVV